MALLREYYAEVGSAAVLKTRLLQVEDEFQTTGTYTQTPAELTFAAKIAWRNSVKCIGRFYWQGLTVRDFRAVTTGAGMLDALFDHIELATNGGNIRPMMTVFAPETPGQPSFRVWSPQLFRYAGYKQADGSVLGDPANLAFTEIAMSLEWQPPAKRGAFDLLPLVVQAPGEKPQWRNIPQRLVKEAEIEHPDLPWFSDLKLKWYALPVVSGMLFDAGGVRYPAAPFNGWYMGTEIGARNFSDTHRYNLLPEIARRMGLDTSRYASLWKDRALVELNVAVLYSFEKAGITILDHHAAAQSFDRFEEIEKRAGRPVYANWSWLVPPVSGSAVSIFHRNWPDVEVKPNYVEQQNPWDRQ
jgi:nitric-oxide synthase